VNKYIKGILFFHRLLSIDRKAGFTIHADDYNPLTSFINTVKKTVPPIVTYSERKITEICMDIAGIIKKFFSVSAAPDKYPFVSAFLDLGCRRSQRYTLNDLSAYQESPGSLQ
jgi:hypothetical protein